MPASIARPVFDKTIDIPAVFAKAASSGDCATVTYRNTAFA
jgi:hypothetical protein